jgi:hypothetical protein
LDDAFSLGHFGSGSFLEQGWLCSTGENDFLRLFTIVHNGLPVGQVDAGAVG